MSFYPAIITGHGVDTEGNFDPGCSYGDYTEVQFATEAVKGCLEALNYNGKRYLTDYPDNRINMIKSVEASNNAGCSHYVSFHVDFSGAPSGIMPLYVSTSGLNLSQSIWNKAHSSTPKREIKYQDDYEVTATDATAVIFEIGSIKADLEYLKANAKLIGRYAAYGIMSYAGESYNVMPDDYIPPEGGNSGDSVTNPYNFTSVFNDNYYLSYGDEGEDVLQFQRDCRFLGYWGENGPLELDSKYGSECKYACECVQRFHGILVDGKYGRISDIRLMTEIADIQKALNKFGYNIKVDGAAGEETLNAFADFQLKNGLTVDRICGSESRKKLGIA